MSCEKGSTGRKNRPQKYKNRTSFRNDLHDKTPKMKFINSIQISEVCQHCKAQLEWKIKYKKYKPLSQPKTCIKCSLRTIKKAYHVMCSACSKAARCCAKCQKPASEQVLIEPAPPTNLEQLKLKAEMDRLIKSLPERKRRTFNRYMKKGKECEQKELADGEDGEEIKKKYVPHTKDELMLKFKALELEEDDDENDLDDEDDYGSDDDSNCFDDSENEIESDNDDELESDKNKDSNKV